MTSLATALPGFRYDREKGRFRDYLGRVVDNAISKLCASRGRLPMRLDTSVRDGLAKDEGEDEWVEEWKNHHFRLAMRRLRHELDKRSLEIFDALIEGATIRQAARRFDTSADVVHKVKQRVGERLRAQVSRQIRAEDGLL